MKTRIQSLSILAILAIAVGVVCWSTALNAQNTPSTSPDRQAQQPSSPDTTPPAPQTQSPSSQTPPPQTPDTQQTPDQTPPPSSRTPESGAQQTPSADNGAAGTQTFSGTVTKQGDKYVLKDDAGHTYDIDHQDEVRKFEGKRVRVQGTLDPSTNKIMVK